MRSRTDEESINSLRVGYPDSMETIYGGLYEQGKFNIWIDSFCHFKDIRQISQQKFTVKE